MNWVPRPAPAQDVPDPQPAPEAEGLSARVDEFIESYVLWRESCEAVSVAYAGWANCEAERRGSAFEDYRAALDWEELAAQVHAGRAARVSAVRA